MGDEIQCLDHEASGEFTELRSQGSFTAASQASGIGVGRAHKE